MIAHGQDSESSGRGVLTTIAFDLDHPRKGTTLGTDPAPKCRPRRGGAFCFPQVRMTCRTREIAPAQFEGQFGGRSIPTPVSSGVGRSGTRFSRAPLVGEPGTPKRESESRAHSGTAK